MRIEHGMKRWEQRVVLVTGASSGIGRSVALRLSQEGMRVVAVGRRMKKLERLANEAEFDQLPGKIWPLQIDLSDEDQILAMFRTIRDRWEGVDVLVNSAGVGRHAPLTTGRTEHWREMININILAASICTREAVADMRRTETDGHIIHISSLSGYRVPPNGGVYSATKAAMRSLTESLRVELRDIDSKIRVSSISPGFVETEFADKFHRTAAAVLENYGKFKMLQAEDIAEAVCYQLAAPPHVQVHDILIRPTGQYS